LDNALLRSFDLTCLLPDGDPTSDDTDLSCMRQIGLCGGLDAASSIAATA
jgi:hypothetical protein